jgi:hypothetical protein
MGGSVGVFGLIGSDAIATGDNSAGNGGDGHFSGTLMHAPVAVFDPVNMAMAGFHGTADAHQSNTVQFLQGASQAAGGAVMAATTMRRAAEACLSSRLARPTTLLSRLATRPTTTGLAPI